LFTKFRERLSKSAAGTAALLRQFYKEKVFFYLMLLVTLMVVFGALFLFIESNQQSGLSTPEKLIKGGYWATVTLASVGYGDVVPLTIAGRVMAIILIFLAMGFVAMFTANLTSALTAKKIREGRGLTDAKNYSNHLLILGWKKDMARLVQHIVTFGGNQSSDIVLVCEMTNEIADDLAAYPELSDMRLVRGKYYSEEHLQLVNPSRAAGILILADESSPATSESEIDSRTVMAAMILSKHVRKAHVVAELLDPAYEPYLKNTKIVDEIIFPRQYTRGFIRMSAGNVGVINTFNMLIDGKDGVAIATYSIPQSLVGKTVDELREQMKSERPGSLLIGLVENTGKYHERKTEAVREAQLTPDMEKLVQNLQKAKQMENNQPRLIPPGDYVIQPYTLAIVIEQAGG
jgi:voltage-gated potassium channel